MPAEADFGRFWADSGPPFGPIFGTFRHFFGGRNFDRFLIDFRDTFARGRRKGAGLRKLILSLQTPNHLFVSEGYRPPLHHALHPEGVRRIYGLRPLPPAPHRGYDDLRFALDNCSLAAADRSESVYMA